MNLMPCGFMELDPLLARLSCSFAVEYRLHIRGVHETSPAARGRQYGLGPGLQVEYVHENFLMWDMSFYNARGASNRSLTEYFIAVVDFPWKLSVSRETWSM